MEINKDFFKKAGIRAIRTVCQTAIATIGCATVLCLWQVHLFLPEYYLY